MKTQMTALIYCRVSSKKQEREGSGLTSQEKRCREYAAIQGYTVEKVFHDAFSGGGDFMIRPAMRELLDYVDEQEQPGYVVIFDDLKRFARDLKFHWELREAFKLRNLTPKCLNFTFEETPEGSFIETIIAAQGELERQQNKRQVIQKMKARMERGIYCMGGEAPFGYVFAKNTAYGGKVLATVPNDAAIAKEAFEGFASTKLFHIKDVQYFINHHPLYIKRKPLRVETVRKMLTNVIYCGYIEYKPWNIMYKRGVHEPIISATIFETVQARIFAKIPQRKRVDIRYDFPLRGFVNCIYCKRPLTASWSKSITGKKHPYYRCRTQGCVVTGKSIPLEEMHANFGVLLKSLIPKPAVLDAVKLAIIKEYSVQEKENSKHMNKKEDEILKLEHQILSIVNRIAMNPESELNDLYEKQILKIREVIKTHKASFDNFLDLNIHSRKDLELLLNRGLEKIIYSYDSWVNGEYEVKKSVQEMLLNSNIEYGRKQKFGTPEKCYVLRLFEEIRTENRQNFGDVDINKITSNMHNQQFDNPIQNNFLRDNMYNVIQAFKNLADFKSAPNELHKNFSDYGEPDAKAA